MLDIAVIRPLTAIVITFVLLIVQMVIATRTPQRISVVRLPLLHAVWDQMDFVKLVVLGLQY